MPHPCHPERQPRSRCAGALVLSALLGACSASSAPERPAEVAAEPRDAATSRLARASASHGPIARRAEDLGQGGNPGDLQRWAVNAMLFTLLDDDQPPRWTDPEVWVGCAPGTEVRVNGEPIVVGRHIPEGTFELSWQAVDCRPLGLDGPAMHGRATLRLTPLGPEGWTAEIRSAGMEWIGPRWSRRLPPQFVAHAPAFHGRNPHRP